MPTAWVFEAPAKRPERGSRYRAWRRKPRLIRGVLRLFGRLQRPVAWTIFGGGVVTFVAVLLDLVRTGDARVATLLGAVLVTNDGFQAAQAVENELQSAGAATDGEPDPAST